MTAPHLLRALVRRTPLIAFAVLAVSFAGATAAQAQTQPSPAPASTPAPETQTPPSANSGGQPHTAGTFGGHLPVIDIVPFFTQPAYYHSTAQLKGYDPLDVGGTVKIPLSRILSVSFDRNVGGTLNQPLDRVYSDTGAPTYPNNSRDVVLVERADLVLGQFTVEAGDSFRHRIWNGGSVLHNNISAQPFPYTLSSTEHHYGYLGVTYATKPIAELGGTNFVLNITGDAQNVDHHVAVLCTGAMVATGANGCTVAGTVGYHDENPTTSRYYETTQSAAVNVPLHRGTTLTVKDAWGALNFYENQPYPWRWGSAFTEQITKKFSPFFSLAVNHQDYHELPDGAPYVAPNSIHVGAWNVFADFHVDLNQVFQ